MRAHSIRPMRRKDGRKAKGLRGLRAENPRAVNRARNQPPGAAPKRIGHRQRRRGPVMRIKRGQQPVDQPLPKHGARAVMDQHARHARPLQSQKPCHHRRIPRGPSGHALHAKAGRQPHVVGVDHHQHRQAAKGRQRMRKHGFPGQHLPLLWHISACAAAATCGDNDDMGAHGSPRRSFFIPSVMPCAPPDNLARKGSVPPKN